MRAHLMLRVEGSPVINGLTSGDLPGEVADDGAYQVALADVSAMLRAAADDLDALGEAPALVYTMEEPTDA